MNIYLFFYILSVANFSFGLGIVSVLSFDAALIGNAL